MSFATCKVYVCVCVCVWIYHLLFRITRVRNKSLKYDAHMTELIHHSVEHTVLLSVKEWGKKTNLRLKECNFSSCLLLIMNLERITSKSGRQCLIQPLRPDVLHQPSNILRSKQMLSTFTNAQFFFFARLGELHHQFRLFHYSPYLRSPSLFAHFILLLLCQGQRF